MRRVGDRPDQTDGNRFVLTLGESPQYFPDRLDIQRRVDPALGVDAAGNLERLTPGDIRLRIGLAEIVRIVLAALLKNQDIRKPLGGEESGFRRVSRNDGIGRAGRAEDQHVRLREKVVAGDSHFLGSNRKGCAHAIE